MKKQRRNRRINLMKGIRKIIKHPLFRNKLYGSILLIIGIIGTIISKDLTMLFVGIIFGLPVIFAKENVIVD